jgi:hypothetical protein
MTRPETKRTFFFGDHVHLRFQAVDSSPADLIVGVIF